MPYRIISLGWSSNQWFKFLADRKILIHWVDPSNPDVKVADKLKQMVERHKAETYSVDSGNTVFKLLAFVP